MAGIVVAYLSRLGTPLLTHEKATLEAVATSVAQIKHYEFAGWHDIARRHSDDIYFVPDDTLMPDEAGSLACGSRGQIVIATADELDAFLDAFPSEELTAAGLVLESNLHDVITLSIGQIAMDGGVISYHGVQRFTDDNDGRVVYGGSDLVCVRGGWEALAELPITKEVRLGIKQAIAYERAMDAYPGFLASRRNYDVGQGLDAQGKWRSGVFEASWRSGGASTAELAALTAFAQDPGLHVVNACSIKEYGTGHEPPPHATIHFHDNDPQDGPMIRYTVSTPSIIPGSSSHFSRAYHPLLWRGSNPKQEWAIASQRE